MTATEPRLPGFGYEGQTKAPRQELFIEQGAPPGATLLRQ